MENIITRREYIQNADKLYKAYYDQIVSAALIDYVQRFINHRDYNNIPLHSWDSMTEYTRNLINTNKWRAMHEWQDSKTYPWSLSDNVCIMKHIAKHYCN